MPISSITVVAVAIGLVVVVATFARLQAVLPQSLKHGRTSAVGTVWHSVALANDAPVAHGAYPCLSVITTAANRGTNST